MNRDDERQRFTRQIGAAFAIMAVTFGLALSSGAPADAAFWFSLVGLGAMLFLFWGVPSLIDVLAYWRTFAAGRESLVQEELHNPIAPDRPAPTMREIAVHGRGGDGALTMIEFSDLHEQAWREALARFLWAAQSEGSLRVSDLEKYVDHREHVVDLTNVLRDAGIVMKAPGVETRLAPGVTFHSAIRRVTRLVSALPLPNHQPPTVRNSPNGDWSELVPTGHERSEQYA